MAGLIEAAKGAEAWLDRWASHVGDCRGGEVCTCGLSAIHAGLRRALLDIEHADKGIPIHPTSRPATGIKGVAYIPEEGDVFGGASYGVRTNQARSVERQTEEAERQRRRQAGEE